MDWKKMMSKYILLIVVTTLFIVTDSVVTQNVSLTSNSDAATPVNLSDVDHHSVRLRHRREAQRIPLSEKQKNEIVLRHNVLRSREDSSNMERLTWHTFLVTAAKALAANCKWEQGYGRVGQNVYAGTNSTINLRSVIQAWYDEQKDYNYDTMECDPGKMCGNYTQLVWATLLEVGCALYQCEPLMLKEKGKEKEIVKYPKALYFVCNYDGGNLKASRGKRLKPFIKGPMCSNCSSGAGWCKHSLCRIDCSSPGPDCNCSAICYNCATLNNETCRCNCAAGWRGAGCKERCTDSDEDCTPDPDAEEGACLPVYGTDADTTWSASTSLMKSHHVMMMMMFVMITTITVSISNRDASL